MKPTKEECWAAFWDIIGPALVAMEQEGVPPSGEVDLDQVSHARETTQA